MHSLLSKASHAWAPMILPLHPRPRNPSHRRCSPNPKLLQIDVCVCVRRKRMFAAEPDGQGQPVLRIPSTRPFCLSAARKTLPAPSGQLVGGLALPGRTGAPWGGRGPAPQAGSQPCSVLWDLCRPHYLSLLPIWAPGNPEGFCPCGRHILRPAPNPGKRLLWIQLGRFKPSVTRILSDSTEAFPSEGGRKRGPWDSARSGHGASAPRCE